MNKKVKMFINVAISLIVMFIATIGGVVGMVELFNNELSVYAGLMFGVCVTAWVFIKLNKINR